MIYGEREAHRCSMGARCTAAAGTQVWAWEKGPPASPVPGDLGRDPMGDAHGSAVARPARTVSSLSDMPSKVSAVVRGRNLRAHRRHASSRPMRPRWSRGRRGLHRRHVRAGKKGGAEVGRCRAGKATKVMAVADRDGLPLAIAIAGGHRHDVVLTDRALEAAFVDELPPRLIADKAWDSGKHATALACERNIELIAPKRRSATPSRRRQDGRSLRRYRRRWKVERLFAWLKQFRRIATRWETKSNNYLGFLHLACSVILLRSF